MRNSQEIWNELWEWSPALAKISCESPYKAPEGYFDGLAGQVLLAIAKEKMGSAADSAGQPASLLENARDKFLFEAPAGYFEHFPENLMRKIRAAEANSPASRATEGMDDELYPAASLLALVGKAEAYRIPTGYLEGFAENLLSRIRAGEATGASTELESLSPLLSQLSKSSPFSMPDGYFAGLSENVLTGAKAVEFVNTELENLSPMMSSLQSASSYKVPLGYFADFPSSMLLKARGRAGQSKLVSLGQRKNWMRYAAAAAVVGILATAAFFALNGKKANEFMAKFDEKQLVDSLRNSNDEDILNYMQSHNLVMPDGNSSVASIDLNDEAAADDLLADVPDNELELYINEHDGLKVLSTN